MLWVVMDDARNEAKKEGKRARRRRRGEGYRKGVKNEKSVRREAFP